MFEEVSDLSAETTISLGGFNKKTRKENPTTAEGYFLGTKQVKSQKSPTGFSKLHILLTSEGNLGVWGKTDLDRKLSTVTPGAMVRITQNGVVKVPMGEMYKFKVEVDRTNTVEVSTPAPGNTESLSASYEYSTESEEDEEEALDEVVPPRPAPAKVLSTPDAKRQAQVKELLSKGRAKTV